MFYIIKTQTYMVMSRKASYTRDCRRRQRSTNQPKGREVVV